MFNFLLTLATGIIDDKTNGNHKPTGEIITKATDLYCIVAIVCIVLIIFVSIYIFNFVKTNNKDKNNDNSKGNKSE